MAGHSARREGLRNQRLALSWFALLTVFFYALGFPSDEIEDIARGRLESATGARAEFQDVEAALDWGVPKLRFRHGRLIWPDGTQLEVSYARFRPKAHWGWLIGRPRFAAKINTAPGNFRGWVSPHRSTLSGRIEEVTLGRLPYERLGAAGFRLEGAAEIALSGRQSESAWNGTILFRAVNGTLTLPNTQLPLAFALLEGNFDLSDSHVELSRELVMEGPMGRIAAAGRVARGVADPGLNLDLQLDLRDPALLQMLAATGLQIRPGAKQVHIGGTLSNPVARARSARRR